MHGAMGGGSRIINIPLKNKNQALQLYKKKRKRSDDFVRKSVTVMAAVWALIAMYLFF
jgi:hypothetical protein